jgi:DNA adenine methylase
LARFVAALIAAQPRRAAKYVEPFAGGAGVALRLLFDEYVDEVVLNDLNPGVAAFWRSVFFRTDELARRVRTCDLSIEEWQRQQDVYGSGSRDDLALGFATFFLNRTNRSGILDARPIGGLEQRGKWGIAARFHSDRLAARIETLGRYRSRVSVYEDDGIDLVGRHLGDRSVFIYADPPYLVHGDDLYLDTLRWSDHGRLAGLLREEDYGWFLTYDADPRVTDSLYAGLRCAQFRTSHTAAVPHVGNEYAVFARGLKIQSLAGLGSRAAQFVAV